MTSRISKKESDIIHQKWSDGLFQREDLERYFDAPHYSKEIGLSKDPDLLAVFWGQKENSLSYLLNEDKKDLHFQLKTWKKLIKEGVMIIRKENNRTHDYKGRKFYSFTLQPADGGNFGADGTQLLFGFFCDGLSYNWTSQKNRDNIVKYLS
jgi:hypothetical protein|tara:strand:+ start:1109 stop:1564 length:456 start_codon:yes stop_codon:yes gene_type:complete